MKHLSYSTSVLRVPSLPLGVVFDLLENPTTEFLKNYLDDPFVEAAIYCASAELHGVVGLWKNDALSKEKKVRFERTILRYLIRMSSRCTPFGAFAGIAPCRIVENGKIELGQKEAGVFVTRLDMEFVCSLIESINTNTSVKCLLRYKLNSTLYKQGNNYRYIEATRGNSKRSYHLTSVEVDPYLEFVVSNTEEYISLDLLKQRFENAFELEDEDTLSYLLELVDSQLLLSELEATTTGETLDVQLLNALQSIIDRITDIDALFYLKINERILRDSLSKLRIMDMSSVLDRVVIQNLIIDQFKTLDFEFNEKNIFQTDFVRKLEDNCVDYSLVETVKDGINVLAKLSSTYRLNPDLEDFKKKFIDRYDGKETPLVQALDIESGIGYGESGKNENGDIHYLIDNLISKSETSGTSTKEIRWEEKIHSYWTTKIINCLKTGAEEIVITDKELEDFPENEQLLHHSYSTIVNVLEKSDGEYKIAIQAAMGPSAASFIGRFSHVDETIASLTKEIIDSEAEMNIGKINAEVNHLPQTRLGNVLQRPTYRDYEIPYLAKGSVPSDKQLSINDLMLSVVRGELILTSRKLNKEVTPYITNALNYKSRGLPIFSFLGDMQQLQGNGGALLNLGIATSIFKHIPRIVYKKIILRKATWFISQNIISTLKNSNTDLELTSLWRNVAEINKIPKYFTINEGDNDLLINSDNAFSLRLFVNELKPNGGAVITESLLTEYKYLRDFNGQTYSNELLLFFKKSTIKTRILDFSIKKDNLNLENVKSQFLPGESCIYFKLYMGFKQADTLLCLLGETLKDLKNKGQIDSWFFIRFKDPEYHIRLRVFADIRLHPQIHEILTPKLQLARENQNLSAIYLTTYERELDRYGYSTIELAETVFFKDSLLVLELILLGKEQEVVDDNFHWNASLYICWKYIKAFNLSIEEECNFIEHVWKIYADEFHFGSEAFRTLDKDYNGKRIFFDNVLSHQQLVDDHKFYNDKLLIDNHFIDINSLIIKIIEKYEFKDRLFKLLESFIHMSVNRTFRSKQRIYEFTIYHFLKRHFLSVKHKIAVQVKDPVGVNQI